MRGRKGGGAGDCYALVVPGLEALAVDELVAAGGRAGEVLANVDRRDSIIRFSMASPGAALECRLLEDVFLLLLDAPVPPIRSAPKKLAATLERPAFERALLAHHALTQKRRGRSFKVIARVSGRQAFTRDELEVAFARAVGALLPSWVATREAAALEIWVHVVGTKAIAGIRVSGDEFAQRRYKRAHLPASLKPSVARAMVAWSGPRDDDVVLDSMCGAGTILRERADAGRARLIVGGDADAGAVEAARKNVGRSPALARWDATRLPLRDKSVDVALVNPPYGRQHGEMRELDRLYRRVTRELARVLKPGGRAVLLTGEQRTMLEALGKELQVRSRQRIVLRGLDVTALVIVRG